jgi:Rrf2 family cysteine metabolism transcriptional repressor
VKREREYRRENVGSSSHFTGFLNVCSVRQVFLPFIALKLSVKSDYAARAVLGLARHFHTGKALRGDDLAAEQNIPSNYLIQILIELKSQQIVKSVRGKDGGYLLARPPGEISMSDILRAVHGQVFDSPAINDPQCATELRDAWKKLRETLESAAVELNFQQLLEASKGESMYYI